MSHIRWFSCSVFIILYLIAFQPCVSIAQDLSELALEDLMSVEIETASKKIQKIGDTPAAAFVMTSDDIKRSGANSIMDLLRLVPGVHVARIDANKWAITCRGFNGRFSNKLLVMIDGRTVYSPIFSGVFWDMQDIMVEDIEKIEVVRGPGSTLWGANAVNGVINIISKNSAKTQGMRIDTGFGTEDLAYDYARYGGRFSDSTTYRISGKYSEKDKGEAVTGLVIDDSWTTSRFGARIDMDKGDAKALFMAEASDSDVNEANLYSSGSISAITPQFSINSRDLFIPTPKKSTLFTYGQYALARFEKSFEGNSGLLLQGYFDNSTRNSRDTKTNLQISDFYAQYRLPAFAKNDVVTGCGARLMNDSFKSENPFYYLDPENESYGLYNFFIQDEIEAIKNTLVVIPGAKFERNDFSGFEFQPSARILLKASETTSVWGAVSRAVRTPSRVEETGIVVLPAFMPGMPDITLNSKGGMRSEKLIAYEMGVRKSLSEHQSADIALFYNDYADLRTVDLSRAYVFTVGNRMKGNTRGLEFYYELEVIPQWRLGAGYSYLICDFKKLGGDPFSLEYISENTDPRNKLELRSSFDLLDSLRLDLWMRYVDEIKAYDIPEYCSLDLAIGWQMSKSFELSVQARDLLDSSHPEYPPEILETLPTEIERSIFAKISWKN